MVSIKFTSLVLGVLFLLQALRVSQGHQARAMNRNGLLRSGVNVLSVQEDLLDATPAATPRKIGLGGRKMGDDELLRKGIQKKQGLSQGNSKISGKDSHAWKKLLRRSQHPLKDQPQEKLNMLEPKTWKCPSLGCASKSEKPVFQEPPDTAYQRDEAERLLNAVNEIVNLIHKDYKGTDKPRRKPPINNREPSD